MTLRHLKIFLAVCETGGMTRAAESLHMSQPPVSQAIAELEQHFGTRLFERLGRGIVISPAGLQLQSYAAHMLNLAAQAEERLKAQEIDGPLRIGASMTVGAVLLPNLLKACAAAKPDLRFTVVVANSGEVQAELEAARLDIGFIEGPSGSQQLIKTTLMEDELVLITRPGQFGQAGSPLQLAALNDQCFYVREAGSGTREIFDSAMASAGLRYKVAGVINEPMAIIKLTALGLGMAFLSRLLIQEPVSQGLIDMVPVQGLSLSRQISLVHHQNKYFSAALREFEGFVLDYFTKDSKSKL